MKHRSKYFWRNFISIFLGGVGSQAMYVLSSNYATIFFTDMLGISAGAAGVIFLLSRIWDGINDPMCGIWIEKSNPRFGKIQTFMAIGGVLTGFGLIMLFTVPTLSVTGRTIWGAVFYNVVGMAFTAVTVATMLQMARGTDEATERVPLTMSYTVSCSIAGIVMAVIITKAMAQYGATSPANGYKMAAVFSASIGIITLIMSAVLFRDREAELESEATVKEPAKTKIRDMIKGVILVPSFLALVAGCCIANLGMGMVMTNMMYYLTYVLENPALMAVLLPVSYIGTFSGSIVSPLFTRFGKKRMLVVSMLLIAVAVLPIRFMEGNVVVLTFSYGLLAGASSIMYTFLQPALVDCAEYTEFKTGIRCQALALTGFTFVSKMTAGFASAILGFALQYAKYDGTAAVQVASAVNMIRNMMFWPAIIAVVLGCVIVIIFYKLDDKEMDRIRETIRSRMNQSDADVATEVEAPIEATAEA